MQKTFNDLSQLTKAILLKDEPRKSAPIPSVDSAKEVVPHPQLSRDEADCLAYFSHTSITDRRFATAGRVQTPPQSRKSLAVASVPTPDQVIDALNDEKAHLAADLADARQALATMEQRALAAEQTVNAQLAKLRAESDRCTRLEVEIRALREKAAETPHEAAVPAPVPSAQPPASVQASSRIPLSTSTSSLHLKSPQGFVETFPGEVREMAIAALADAQATAAQSTRERRAAVLEAILAANPSSGELERRRAELRQILKDASYAHDEHTIRALEKLGMKLISGKKHWKLEYGNIRMPMSKTPSDWRANLNSSADMANRCF